MMFDPNNLLHSLFIIPILNVLIGIYKGMTILGIPGAFGLSLIALTVLIRFILHPLTIAQLKSTRKLQTLKPELDKLSEKHKDDKQLLHQEQLKLYQQAGVNPAAGCLPLLLQMPILIALYNLFFQLLNAHDTTKIVDAINHVIYHPILKISSFDLSFFGLNLAHKPSDWQRDGIFLLAIPVITGLLQYWQTKTMTPATPPPAIKPAEKKKASLVKVEPKKEEEDMSVVMQKQMAIMMPLMIGFFAYSFPLGLSLYWNTFTVFGIIQQYYLNKSLKNT